MAMEPTNSSDSGVTMLALIVGALVVLVALLFAGGAFETRAPAKNTISIDTPASNPAPATTPSND
jgi:hypothetical protein